MMVRRKGSSIPWQWALVLFAFALVVSCTVRVSQPQTRLDSPEHHTYAGIRLLDQQKLRDAGREFELALRLNPGYAGAHVGIALVRAYQQDFHGGFAALEQAEKHARTPDERLFLQVGAIRVQTLSHARCLQVGTECGHDDRWLRRAQEAFAQAVQIDPRAPAPYYFIGEALLSAFDSEQAGRMFARVEELRGEYRAEAEGRRRLVDKIRQAMPESRTGKKVALLERVTRGEMAALFVDELKIGELHAQRRPKGKGFDAAFREPGKAKPNGAGRIAAADIGNHPLRAPIEAMIGSGMRDFKPYPDGHFRPEERVDRVTFAMMLEELLIGASGEASPAARLKGRAARFPDLQPGLLGFKAVMAVTARGWMQAADPVSGAFSPHAAVTGGDALLAIRKIRDEFRY